MRIQVDISLVVRHGSRLDGLVTHLRRQLLERVISVLTDQVALFQPSFDSGRGANPGKAAVPPQDLHRLTVFYGAGFVVHQGYLIAQNSLRRGHVGHLLVIVLAAIATLEQSDSGHQQQQDENFGTEAAVFHGIVPVEINMVD